MISWIIGILVALVLVIEHMLRLRRRMTRTPYQDIAAVIQRRESRGKPVGKVYDFFMSYKSEDVAAVRHVAEHLIAEGLNVWFAEYTILLSDRQGFQDFVDKGIRQSRYGVCFTNDRYVSSPYCRIEIEQMLDPAICGPENLIEIRLPSEPLPHRKYPQLARSPSVEYSSVVQALQHIRDVSRTPIRPITRPGFPEESRREFSYAGRRYSLDLGGWDVEDRPAEPASPGSVYGPKFTQVFGLNEAMGHVIVGQQDVPRKSVRGGTQDDRAYYDDALNFANTYFHASWKQTCIGAHLLFVQDFSQVALTTMFRPGVWSRLYSVVVPHPDSAEDTEFAFFFFFKGDFRKFCRHAYGIDRVVQSLRWV